MDKTNQEVQLSGLQNLPSKSSICSVLHSKRLILIFIIILLVIAGGGLLFAYLGTNRSGHVRQDKFAQIQQELGCNSQASCIAKCAKPENQDRCRRGLMQGMNANQQVNNNGVGQTNNLSFQLSGGQCQGSGTKEFGSPPMNIADIGSITPLGYMIDAHVTPIDHIYFNPKIFNSPRDKYPVFAISDGTIVDIEHRTNFIGTTHPGQLATNEYRVVVEYSCTFYSYYDLITTLAPTILSQAGNVDMGQNRSSPIRIPIKQGQEIGRIGGQTLDFAVWNTHVTLKGFIVPEHYQGEPWKIHTDDPFKYFKKPLKDQLLALDQRTAEPRQGKIDYDIDGKLVGTWFKQGSGGYDYAQNHRDSSWTTQLSIVYDHLDPTQIRVSIGDYGGKPAQFGVKGNLPDPATIDKNSGLVKYELEQYDYFGSDGTPWDRFSVIKNIQARNSNQIMGVALVQMLDNRKIKFEAFPNSSETSVANFDNNAVIYER